MSSPRLASGASRRRSGDGVATRVARVVRRPRRSQGVRRRMPRCRGGAWTSSGPRAVTSRGSRHKDVFQGCVSLVKGVSALWVSRVHPQARTSNNANGSHREASWSVMQVSQVIFSSPKTNAYTPPGGARGGKTATHDTDLAPWPCAAWISFRAVWGGLRTHRIIVSSKYDLLRLHLLHHP